MGKKGSRLKLTSFLCMGRKAAKRNPENVIERFYQRSGKKEPMEAWPTSPVLMEETNARQKEKAHKYYERQLKACSWYSKIPQRAWIEIVDPVDGGDTCTECCYEEACGCILVSNQPDVDSNGKRRETIESGRSSLDVPRPDSAASRTSKNSRASTEESRSFYDNLCQVCKSSTLERRARKYGESRRRWSPKMAETRAEDELQDCTCAMDHLSFIEWKKLYERDELVRFSKVDVQHQRSEIPSTSDYGTQKSKDSDSTAAGRDHPACLIAKSTSLGYDSEQELDNVLLASDSSYPPTDASDFEGSGKEIDCTSSDVRRTKSSRENSGDPRSEELFDDKMTHMTDNVQEQMKNMTRNSKNGKDKISKHTSSRKRPRRTGEICDKSAPSDNSPEKSFSGRSRSHSVGSTVRSEGETSNCDEKGLRDENNGIPSICMTPIDEHIPAKTPTENDETSPPDVFSEFVVIAKSIDEFYENIHAKQFLKNRVTATNSNDSVEDIREKQGTYTVELRKRIQSLERLCSFVDQSDDETFENTVSSESNTLSPPTRTDKSEQQVWRLSQQNIDLTLKRRTRSSTSSNPSRSQSSTGSGANSRCSTRQSNYANGKSSVTSADIRSPDSGFSEKASSFTALNSPEDYRLGTKWIGSMQWDYTDWTFYFGFGCNGNEQGFTDENSSSTKHESNLATVQRVSPIPQDPLDWDW